MAAITSRVSSDNKIALEGKFYTSLETLKTTTLEDHWLFLFYPHESKVKHALFLGHNLCICLITHHDCLSLPLNTFIVCSPINSHAMA